MTKNPNATIRFLGANRDYADGAEEEVLSVLDKVGDRSDGSDELFRHAVDWPTTYHFSPLRSNLLRPFAINKNHRVLEIGAGTGAITRYLGECGADVVALEGESTRARAIALRCSDLPNVEVVSGSLCDFHDPSGFDLVVVVGVLEYAGPASSDSRHQLEFLRQASDLSRPDGALVLAIENQIGLKYLLGYSEDHLNDPWIGIEGYPGKPAACTVPRGRLSSLLEESGLSAQRWYYPYPDYKLPRTILAEQAFELPTSKELVDQLVGRPIQDLANPPTRFCDDRACHRVFLEAGLGAEVANSFLVVASRRDAGLDRFTDDSVIAWHFSSDRLKCWRRSQIIRRSNGELRLTAAPIYPDAPTAEATWLEHDPTKDEEFVPGRTLEQQALESSRNGDQDGLAAVLQRWHAILAEEETPPSGNLDEDFPFAPRPGRSGLPPEYLDASLSNFVDSGDRVVFVDREWRLGSRVDATLARLRTLWYFALELVVSGVAHPFSPDTSVDDLAIQLAKLAGLDLDRRLIEEIICDEAGFQEVVTGTPARSVETDLRNLGSRSRTEEEVASKLPVSRIRRDLVQLGGLIAGLESQAEDSRQYQIRLEKEITASGTRIRKLEGEYRRLEASAQQLEIQNKEVEGWADSLETQIQDVRSWADGLKAENQKVGTWAKSLETQLQDVRSWADSLEAENQKVGTWAKSLETQLQDVRSWADSLEAKKQKVGTWAKSLETRNQEVKIRARNLETRNQEMETQAQALAHELAEAEQEAIKRGEDYAALNLQLSRITSEAEELRSWKERVSRRPMVRVALAVHRFFTRGEADN